MRLPEYNEKENQTYESRGWRKLVGLTGLALLVGYGIISNNNNCNSNISAETFEDLCPTLNKLVPSEESGMSELEYFKSDEFRNKSLQVWADAVRIPTENFDDLGNVGEDKRWDVFYNFSDYLVNTFPSVSKNAELTKINTHGLLFRINGTDESLKPVMLCGHQDVVPVPKDGVSRWTYPPFSGVYDGEYLWGRGSSDCKNNVIAIFEALDELLASGYSPKRGVIIALGFDEETSGFRGASKIGEYLKSTMGNDSVFMIIDEGGLGIQDIEGGRFALPSTGEKGYVDITIELITTGGHSSVPPKHTGIGMIADLIHEIEAEDYPLDVSPKNPFFYQLQCEAKGSKEMSQSLKSDISKLGYDSGAKSRVLDYVSQALDRKALISTTQAIDIVYGGLKINALPERVTIKINHRVSYESSLEHVKAKIMKAVDSISEKFSIDIEAFGEIVKEYEVSSGIFKVSTQEPLDPAPSTNTINNPSWKVLGGTIRHVFEDFAEYPDGSHHEVIVSPSCMTGNTDTRHYWGLTDNIYRFTPIRQNMRFNAHAIDERVSLTAHIEGVVFFHQLIKNLDTI